MRLTIKGSTLHASVQPVLGGKNRNKDTQVLEPQPPADRGCCVCHQVPTLRDYQPQRGPVAGGTNITVHGSDLDIGSNVSVTLTGSASKVECQVY